MHRFIDERDDATLKRVDGNPLTTVGSTLGTMKKRCVGSVVREEQQECGTGLDLETKSSLSWS